MFVNKNKSGTVSVRVLEKGGGNNILIKSFGSSRDDAEIEKMEEKIMDSIKVNINNDLNETRTVNQNKLHKKMTKILISQHVFPKGNPWEKVDYRVAETPTSGNGWILPEDKEVLCENKNPDNLNLAPNPVPWAGRWNNEELPLLVILGLNPSSGYDNANQKGSTSKRGDKTDSTYSELVVKNLRGEAGLGDLIFSKEMHDRSSYPQDNAEKTNRKSYWLEHLYPLYKAVFANQAIEKDGLYELIRYIDVPKISEDENPLIKKTKEFFDLILTVELFPYHTIEGRQIGSLFKKVRCDVADKSKGAKKVLKYPSSEINAALVRYLIDKNATVIAARSQQDWADALGYDTQGSQYIEKCLYHKNPRQMYISEANLTNDAWNDLVYQFQKKLNLPIRELL